MPRAAIAAIGTSVPDRVVTNQDLTRLMETSDEWITQRSGIKTRHWVEPGTTCSTLALEATRLALTRADMQPSDLDCIVFAERPKIAPHRDAIRCRIAEILDLEPDCVGVKAKTGEGLGAIGRGEAIAVQCAVLLIR